MKYKANQLKINYVMFQIAETISFIFGLSPCKISIEACSLKKKKFAFKFSFSLVGCVWNILLKILFFTLAIYSVPFLKEIHYPNNSITIMAIITALAVVGNLFAMLIISIYSIRQKHIIKIGNRLRSFDEKFGSKLFTTNDNVSRDIRNIVTILIQLVIWFGLCLTTLIGSEKIFLLTSGVCLCFLSWFIIQYSLIINILRERLKIINNAFHAIVRCPIVCDNQSIFSGNIFINRLTVQNFFIIKQARNMIYNISRKVSEFYSFPVLLVIFYHCCCFTDTVYFFITSLLSSKNFDLNCLNSIFWGLMCIYPVITLSASINSFQSEMDRTSKVLYDIMESYIPHKEMEYQLNNFAVELLHKNVRFSACGLFSLDCTLLHSIFGMIVTYLLILLQFKPADAL